VTCIVLPHDLQELPAVDPPPREHGTVHSGIGHTGRACVPEAPDLVRAAEVLNAGERVAMLVGAGALNATDEVVEVAQLLGAGIAKALLGKAAVPDELPYVTGAIGLVGTKPSWDLMEQCDTLLMVGSSFPYSEFLPKEGQARGVQIDIDERMLSLRYPMEVNLVGDSAATLRALIPHLHRKTERGWRERIERDVARWWRVLEARAKNEARPVNPQLAFWELSPRLPENCIVTCDSGSCAHWYARDVRLQRGMMGSLSGGLATMGTAVPYAIAAKLAHPERAVIALAGDGAMQMNGINALVTIARLWRDWSDPRLVVLVLDNRDLNLVSWEQRVSEGQPRLEASQSLPEFSYAAYAEMLGLRGLRVDRPDAVGAAWDEALGADRPTVIDLIADPNVPPLPPHVSGKQARNYATALLKGDSETLAVLKATAREWWDGLFPAKR
jgi:pyruvate dehydrogenase (quinone)